MRRLTCGLALILMAAASDRASAQPKPGLEDRVKAVLKTPGFETAHWGLYVVDSSTGEVVYQRNPDELFKPASVTKVYSCAAALIELGGDYRFKTQVVRRGEVKNGVLKGDLILVASGDLSLGGRTGPEGTLLFEDNDHTYAGGSTNASLVAGNPLAGLDHLARVIHDEGIKEIQGDVLVDDRMFDPAPSTGSGPSRVSPVVVNDNVVDVVVTAGSKPGDKASVKLVPDTQFVQVDDEVETVAEGALPRVSVQSVGPRKFRVRGTVPAGHKPFVRIYEVEEPDSFARALLIERLRGRGVKISASPLGENDREALPPREETKGLPKVAEYVSPPFSEYLKVILKVSLNLHASTLPLLIAAKHGERTLSQGLKRQARAIESLGVDVATISFGGGAGGSDADLTTPRATVTLLKALSKRPDYSIFEAALPVLGRDGTLAKAVAADSPARGHVKAKTGTYWVDNLLTGRSIITSKALAGTIETASGRKLTFAFFLNNIPAPAKFERIGDATAEAGRVLGRLCEVFYNDLPADAKAAKVEEAAPAVGR